MPAPGGEVPAGQTGQEVMSSGRVGSVNWAGGRSSFAPHSRRSGDVIIEGGDSVVVRCQARRLYPMMRSFSQAYEAPSSVLWCRITRVHSLFCTVISFLNRKVKSGRENCGEGAWALCCEIVAIISTSIYIPLFCLTFLSLESGS